MIPKMKYLTDKRVSELLAHRWGEIIDRVENAFIDETADMVPKVYLEGKGGDFRAMPAALKQFAALKWIGVFPNNWQVDDPRDFDGPPLPTTLGSLILSDRHTGFPLMAMDCTTLTAYRTAATSAIAAKYCAPKNLTEIAFIGCGKQAYYHALAYKEIFGDYTATLCDKNTKAAVKLSTLLNRHGMYSHKISYHTGIVEHADIITTLTPSTEPYLNVHNVKSNCHINAVGADAKGKRELMTNVIDGAADIICDDPEQAFHSGELQYNQWPDLEVLSLSDVIKSCNLITGFQSLQLDKGISIFDSTGVAIEDIAIAILIYEICKAETEDGPNGWEDDLMNQF